MSWYGEIENSPHRNRDKNQNWIPFFFEIELCCQLWSTKSLRHHTSMLFQQKRTNLYYNKAIQKMILCLNWIDEESSGMWCNVQQVMTYVFDDPVKKNLVLGLSESISKQLKQCSKCIQRSRGVKHSPNSPS